MKSGEITTGTRLGDFEIVREVGRGGMGVVYEAKQLSVNCTVALKILPSGLGMTRTARQRFHREAQAAAKLHHDHIVKVHAEGEDQGTCYFAMELVEGKPLDQFISGQRLIAPTLVKQSTDGGGSSAAAELPSPPVAPADVPADSPVSFSREHIDDVAGWIADVADALEYAHQQGVIHRDIKPSNLMLASDGRVRLMDFGLARVQDEPGLTVSGEMLGTPRYMSPEQITAGRMLIDHRTDVYSLGATLYELLTLTPPFPGESRDQIITQIISKEAKAPRQIDRRIPVDLETICLKAIEKDPDRRYQTAGKMATDLRRFVNRYAISAQRAGPVERAIQWARRRPAVAVLSVCVVLAVLSAGFLARRARTLAEQRLAQLRETAITQSTGGNLPAAEAAIAEAQKMGVFQDWMHLLLGQAAIRQGDAHVAIREFQVALQLNPNSTAAHAMLCYSDYISGNKEKYVQGIGKLKSMEMASFEDYLFAGQAVARGDPEWGLELLAEANEQRKTAISYRTSAEIRLNQAWTQGDTEQAEQAVRDATIAQEMLQDPLAAACIRLWAHIAAATLYADAGRLGDVQRHLDDADQVDASIPDGEHRSLPLHFLAKGFYLDFRERDAEAYDFYERIARSDHFVALKLSIISLYRLDRFKEAERVFGHLVEYAGGDESEVAHAFLLAEAQGPQAAQVWVDELVQRTKLPGPLPYYPTVHLAGALQLLGKSNDAKSLMLALRERIQEHPMEPAWFEILLSYLCGDIDRNQLLEAAGSGNERRLIAHFHIAMNELGRGNRVGALEHLTEAKRMGMPPLYEWHWASAFHRRLKRDASWPPWIPE